MNYTMDRFPARKESPSAVEALKATMQVVSLSGSLERLMSRKSQKDQANTEAQKAMVKVISQARMASGEDDQEDNVDLASKVLRKVLRFVGKKIVKTVVKQTLKFAGRVAMNLVRIAARTVLRFVIIPVMEAIAAFAVANPITAGILAVAAVGAGGYYLWKKFFAEPEVKKEVVAAPTDRAMDEELQEVAPGTVQETGGQAVVEGAAQTEAEVATVEAPKQTLLERTIETVKEAAAPVIKAVTPTKAPAKKGKFTGFGKDMDGYIKEAATKFPILPEDELRGFIKMEAGWTGAMSPTGAIGTGQFIVSTWNDLIGQGGAALGMEKITGIYKQAGTPKIQANPNGNFRTEQDPRFDRRVNTLATALLASQNAQRLKKAGLPITGTNLYLLHNVGPGIIDALLGKPVSDKVLKAISQQGGVFKNATAAQYVEEMGKRYKQAYADANTQTTMTSDQPQLAEGKALEKPAREKTAKPVQIAAVPSNTATNKSGELVKGPGQTIVRAA